MPRPPDLEGVPLFLPSLQEVLRERGETCLGRSRFDLVPREQGPMMSEKKIDVVMSRSEEKAFEGRGLQ